MPAIRTLALVLRTVEVFETSLVATLFTRELGKVAVLAKGARRLKSPFQGGLDLLGVSDIVMFPKASEALDLLAEAVPVERFASLRRDLAALYAGYYIAELLTDLTDLHDPHPKLFDAARITLRHLGDADLRTRRIMRFELACLRELGLMPAARPLLPSAASPSRPIGGSGLVRAGVAAGSSVTRAGPASRTSSRFRSRDLEAIRVLASPGNAWRELDVRQGSLVAGSRDGRGGHQSCPGASSPAPALTGSVTRWFGLIETFRTAGSHDLRRRGRPDPSSGSAGRLRSAELARTVAEAGVPPRARSLGRLPDVSAAPSAQWRAAYDGNLVKPTSKEEMADVTGRPIHRNLFDRWLTPKRGSGAQDGRLGASTLILGSDGWRPMAKPAKNPEADAELEAAHKLFQQGKFAEAEKQFAKIAKNRKGTPGARTASITWPRPSFSARNTSTPTTASSDCQATTPATEYQRQSWSAASTRSRRSGYFRTTPTPPRTSCFPGTGGSTAGCRSSTRQGTRPQGPRTRPAQRSDRARWPTMPRIQIAEYYMKHHDYESAAIYYDQFIDRVPQEPLPPEGPARRDRCPDERATSGPNTTRPAWRRRASWSRRP